MMSLEGGEELCSFFGWGCNESMEEDGIFWVRDVIFGCYCVSVYVKGYQQCIFESFEYGVGSDLELLCI